MQESSEIWSSKESRRSARPTSRCSGSWRQSIGKFSLYTTGAVVPSKQQERLEEGMIWVDGHSDIALLHLVGNKLCVHMDIPWKILKRLPTTQSQGWKTVLDGDQPPPILPPQAGEYSSV